jgi:hypothetical protein
MRENVIAFITDPFLLAVMAWVTSIGLIIVGIRILYKVIKNIIKLVTKIYNIRNIQLDSKGARLINELFNEGIVNFFPYPQTYIEYLDHGKPAIYMKTAKSKLLYVGYWLTHTIALGGIPETIKTLLNNGVEVSIVLMNPYSNMTIEYCKKYFGFNQNYIESEFTRALISLQDFFKSHNLSKDEKSKLKIKVHSEPINAAIILFDWDDEQNGKLLLDTKLHGAAFSEGYGFELKNNKMLNGKMDSLYSRIKKSYLRFIESDKYPLIQTIDVDIYSDNSIDLILSEIKRETNEIR